MIPSFNADGNLPPGIHWAEWPEIVSRFGTNTHRKRLLEGLYNALIALKQAGCTTAFIDGSFVTKKDYPQDFDACWNLSDVDPTLLDPVLLDFSQGRAAQKNKYFGELFPAHIFIGNNQPTFLEFFQTDKNTGRRKGIIAISLETLDL